MKPGEVVWANLDKKRPCVILQVKEDGRALLLWGKRKPRPDWRHEKVAPPARLYRQMKLIAPTYFYSENHAVVSDAQIEDRCGNCPPRFYEKLVDLIEESALSSFAALPSAEVATGTSATPGAES